MTFGVMNGVGRGIDVLDGAGDRLRVTGNFGVEFGASRCNQWGLCGVVILCREG